MHVLSKTEFYTGLSAFEKSEGLIQFISTIVKMASGNDMNPFSVLLNSINVRISTSSCNLASVV